MASETQWRQIEAITSSIPLLFMRLDFHESGYTVLLTDLLHVWQENLSKSAIYERADKESCPIDPSEDAAQLRILLEKIDGALCGAQGSSASLERDVTDDDLVISIRAPLPSPLPQLQWRLVLARQPPKSFMSEVVRPLLSLAKTKEAINLDLQSRLREKDQVISRLLDRLETSGTDLTTVFPGTSNVKLSRKASQRSQLVKYVKGLQAFDPQEIASLGPASSSSAGVDIVTALNEAEAQRQPALLSIETDYRQDWWSTVESTNIRVSHSSPSIASKRSSSGGNGDEDETDDEEFQVQETPNKTKSGMGIPTSSPASSPTRYRSNNAAQHEESHKGEDLGKTESTTPSPEPEPPVQPTGEIHKPTTTRTDAVAARPGRLGLIGGSKPKPPQATHPKDQAEATLADGGDQEDQKLVDHKTTRSKLGVIGGLPRAKMHAESKASSNIKPSHEGDKDVSAETGGKVDATATGSARLSSPPSSDLPNRGRRGDKPPEPTIRETSEERANRRRNELKHKLEVQAKPTIAKKRRF